MLRTAEKKIPHILVVDDDAVIRLTHASLLEQLGYQVSIASDGLEAIALIEKNIFDAICMDVNMPNMDGIELTMAIRSRKDTSQYTPIIGISSCSENQKKICLEKGMNTIFSKPIEKEQLAFVIEQYLGAEE